MNKIILMGRLTRDPEVRYSQQQNGESLAIAKYSLAVDRKFAKKQDGDVTADFFNCTAFGKQGEFVEKYLKQGTKILMTGRVENDNYTNKNGEKVYSIRIVTEEIEFAESKNASAGTGNAQQGGQGGNGNQPPQQPADDGFMDVPPGLENDLPFK